VAAASKLTLCLARFDCALCASHSKVNTVKIQTPFAPFVQPKPSLAGSARSLTASFRLRWPSFVIGAPACGRLGFRFPAFPLSALPSLVLVADKQICMGLRVCSLDRIGTSCRDFVYSPGWCGIMSFCDFFKAPARCLWHERRS
jgi:hypothetical protein